MVKVGGMLHNQDDLALLLDAARTRRDGWILQRVLAQDVGNLALMKQANRMIADCDEIIADLKRALPKDGVL